MKPAFPIYLLRHGQTEWNRDDKRQGRLESPLTVRGLDQAAAMGRTLAATLDRTLDWQLLASPQPRAFGTAAIVAQACGISPAADPLLMEIGMGSWEGLTWPEIDAMAPGTSEHKKDHPQFHAPDGERFADTVARATEWLGRVERPTIAVSHGMIGLVLRMVYLGLDEAGLRQLPSPRQDSFFYLADGNIDEVICK